MNARKQKKELTFFEKNFNFRIERKTYAPKEFRK